MFLISNHIVFLDCHRGCLAHCVGGCYFRLKFWNQTQNNDHYEQAHNDLFFVFQTGQWVDFHNAKYLQLVVEHY